MAMITECASYSLYGRAQPAFLDIQGIWETISYCFLNILWEIIFLFLGPLGVKTVGVNGWVQCRILQTSTCCF